MNKSNSEKNTLQYVSLISMLLWINKFLKKILLFGDSEFYFDCKMFVMRNIPKLNYYPL